MRVIHLEISDDDNRFRSLISEDKNVVIDLLIRQIKNDPEFEEAVRLALVKTSTHYFAKHISTLFGVKDEDLQRKFKPKEVVHIRQLGMWYLIKYRKLSHSQSGSIFNRDHATALHAFNVIEN